MTSAVKSNFRAYYCFSYHAPALKSLDKHYDGVGGFLPLKYIVRKRVGDDIHRMVSVRHGTEFHKLTVPKSTSEGDEAGESWLTS